MSLSWKDFQGVNAAAALELYDRFRDNPASVDEATRAFFERVPPPPEVRATVAAHLAPAAPAGARGPSPKLVVGAVNLAHAIRRYGHLAAEIDPLGSRPMGDPTLRPETHGVTDADLRDWPRPANVCC